MSKYLFPPYCDLWCHRDKAVTRHARGKTSLVCSQCGNAKHPAEVVAIYSADEISQPMEVLLPTHLLPPELRNMKYRNRWL